MDIEYIHFYVDDALAWRNWFTTKLGFASAGGWCDRHSYHERVYSGAVRFLLSSAQGSQGPIAQYLTHHPQGVVDVALNVTQLPTIVERARQLGATVLQSITPLPRPFAKSMVPAANHQWARVSGWGNLRHTLIQKNKLIQKNQDVPWQTERQPRPVSCSYPPQFLWPRPTTDTFQRIDHCVLNVASGDLERAVQWYQQLFELSPEQSFHIETPRSGLNSQVLVGEPLVPDNDLAPDDNHRLQFPINEPTSANSQIQEFLDHNRGPGIQHIALLTPNLLKTIVSLRAQGVKFLAVPSNYYDQIPHRAKFGQQGLAQEWDDIRAQQALVDWHLERSEGALLQIFTQTIFPEPTFFLELIERRALPTLSSLSSGPRSKGQNCYAQGFGEGNFQALFEAIEQAQLQRS